MQVCLRSGCERRSCAGVAGRELNQLIARQEEDATIQEVVDVDATSDRPWNERLFGEGVKVPFYFCWLFYHKSRHIIGLVSDGAEALDRAGTRCCENGHGPR